MANCPKCTQPISSGAKFCPECGAAVCLCHKCATVITPSIKFCPQCGSGVGGTASQSSSNIEREVARISREAAIRAANPRAKYVEGYHPNANVNPQHPRATTTPINN